ncbi:MULTISPECIES: helix-turn-helix transcriptional regulator [unclassified Streptomyces]|uniref:ArsR/SmtB family transcription factor n=1 Tax=unclassified Streptomyces TaxID=2593676 RepID=UPI001B3837C5|nr:MULTISPECIES: winged helix-turn-helix domain-containing protein [unclassified Streptomyces]MBQ0865864.1 winged helix-turn-helix transcriptional regulator [Streptomyces sp. RK75]MBQ1123290.1 winged helix-turn-helix transcriptional regulator [Streptomyces sp. B15]
MGIRIHLSSADMRRVTVARSAEPLCEMERSLRALQLPARDPSTALWRDWARRRLPRAAQPLLTLVPPSGPCPDFLTPLAADAALDTGVEAVLSTPSTQLNKDLEQLSRTRRLPGWAMELARGRVPALRSLERAVRVYHQALLQPMEQHLASRFDIAAGHMTRILAQEGLDALLGGLHPSIRWDPPVLDVAHQTLDEDIFLRGRGLHLIPSFFSASNAVMVDSVSTYVLVFPMPDRPAWHPGSGGPRQPLAALVGDTRARLLYALARGPGMSTTALARVTATAPSTASHHTAALRAAGLIVTNRAGTGVLHSLTPLGTQLLGTHPRSPG